MIYQNLPQKKGDFPSPLGSVSKPGTPVVHIKIAGIYGCE